MTDGITLNDLVDSTRINPAVLDRILREDERRGLVEETDDGRWRLTRAGERHYGPALRTLGDQAALAPLDDRYGRDDGVVIRQAAGEGGAA